MDLNYDNHLSDFSNVMDISHYENSLALSPPPVIQATSIQDQISNWCTICYYEMNTRIGTPFMGNHQTLVVDGFTDPNSCSDRFCLGLLSNVNRDQTIEQTRRFIGKGVKIYRNGPEVFAECLSNCAIFVQSSSLSKELGYTPDYVYKVTNGGHIKIFNNQLFADLLTSAAPEGYEAVYSLMELCTIRMSFVKGWGPDYKRQHVTSAPCWIEIRLNGPLQWLDRILSQIGSSGAQCSSMS